MATSHRFLLPLTAALAAGALALTGCSNGGDGGDPADDGIPYGASKADYIAAFEDLDPITIRMQTEGTEGTDQAAPREALAAALEEWSGGKITVEMGYSNSFCANAQEWNDCLEDGRVDIALAQPSYEPDLFPLLSGVATAGVLVPFTSTGPMIATAWVAEVGYSEDYLAEYHDNGIQPLLPMWPSFSYTTMFCATERTSLADFAGLQISASGTLKAAEVTALGGTPVAMPFTDQYEALQRGVIGCALTSTGAVDAAGLEPLTPFAVFDGEVAWEAPVSTLSAGKDFWDGLPLVAQQLIFDQLGPLTATMVPTEGSRTKVMIDELLANGGGLITLDDDAREAVQAANDKAVDALPDADNLRETAARWTEIVNDELDYGSEPFGDWIIDEGYLDRDRQPFLDRLYEDVLLEHRPGGSGS